MAPLNADITGLPPGIEYVSVIASGTCSDTKTGSGLEVPKCVDIVNVFKNWTRHGGSITSGPPSFYVKTGSDTIGGVFKTRTIFYSAWQFGYFPKSTSKYVLASVRAEEWIFESDNERITYIAKTSPHVVPISYSVGFGPSDPSHMDNASAFNNNPLVECKKYAVGFQTKGWQASSRPTKANCTSLLDFEAYCCENCNGWSNWVKNLPCNTSLPPLLCSCEDWQPSGCSGAYRWVLTRRFTDGEVSTTTMDFDGNPYRLVSSTEQFESGSLLTLHTIEYLPRPKPEFYGLPDICKTATTSPAVKTGPSLSHVYNCNAGECKSLANQ